MSITLNGTTGISTPDITSTTAPSLVGTNFTSLPSASLTGALPAIDGSSLTSLTSASLTGALPAIDGSNLTGIPSGYTAKAWVNFNGESTVAIRADGNVSSITDHGTGDYTVNITTSLSSANYSTSALCQDTNDDGASEGFNSKFATTPTSSAARFRCARPAWVNVDSPYLYVSFTI